MSTEHGVLLFTDEHWGASKTDDPSALGGGRLPGRPTGLLGSLLWPVLPAIRFVYARRAAMAWWEPGRERGLAPGSAAIAAAVLLTPVVLVWVVTTLALPRLYLREAVQAGLVAGLVVAVVAAVAGSLRRQGISRLHGAEHQVAVACMDHGTLRPTREQVAAVEPVQMNCGSSTLLLMVLGLGTSHVALAAVPLPWAVPARVVGMVLTIIALSTLLRLHHEHWWARVLLWAPGLLAMRFERLVIAEPREDDRDTALRALEALRAQAGIARTVHHHDGDDIVPELGDSSD